jgi:hypothetical protein
MASDGDITRPHNPLPRLEVTSNPSHWHVQLEVRPEQLAALQRMGYTSGALAWREGMDGWQPLRVGVEVETELSEADIESSDEDGDEREASGTQTRLDDAEPTLARTGSRRSFVFPRGHAPGDPVALVPAPPISNRPPAPEEHVLDDLFARPLPPPPRMPGSVPPRSSDEVSYEPHLHAAAQETEARYTPAPLALVPKPSWLTQTHRVPVAIERPISIPPPAVLDMYHGGPHALLRQRTLWLGMGATVLLSAAVAALVSSLVWHLQGRFADASASTIERAAALAPAEPPKRAETIASAPAEPQPTSVSVEELPLLRGTLTAPVTITTPDPPRRQPEHRELPRREPERAVNVEDGSNRSPSRAAFLGRPQSGKGGAPVAKQSSAIDQPIAERVAEEAEPAKNTAPLEAPGPATPTGPADRDAVAKAVAQAAVAARSCGTSPETGQVMVKFAPSGSAQSIQLLKPFSNRDVNACVLRAMSRARVAPFLGEAVSVRKSVRW